jgi:hypothetical protein
LQRAIKRRYVDGAGGDRNGVEGRQGVVGHELYLSNDTVFTTVGRQRQRRILRT